MSSSGGHQITTATGVASVVNRPKLSTGPPTPLKATIPITSATKEGSHLRGASPTSGSTPTRILPNFRKVVDIPVSPSVFSSNKSPKTLISSNAMRRTASLDAIYSRGFFSRDGLQWHRNIATQTEISNSLDSLAGTFCTLNLTNGSEWGAIQVQNSSLNPSTSEEYSVSATETFSTGIWRNSGGSRTSRRSSEEGLNMEIERITQRSEELRYSPSERTAEGRKAPIADLLRRRSANTQTPPYYLQFPANNATIIQQAFTKKNSLQFLCATQLFDLQRNYETEDSQGSSPEAEADRVGSMGGSSPQINRFQRQPPPDCERIKSSSSNSTVPSSSNHRFLASGVVKPVPIPANMLSQSATGYFTLRPSSQSAFEQPRHSDEPPNNIDKNNTQGDEDENDDSS